MRKPRLEEFFDETTGDYDYEAYEEILGEYEDNAYDQWRDEEILENE